MTDLVFMLPCFCTSVFPWFHFYVSLVPHLCFLGSVPSDSRYQLKQTNTSFLVNYDCTIDKVPFRRACSFVCELSLLSMYQFAQEVGYEKNEEKFVFYHI